MSDPVAPRPAATVLLVRDDPFEVLMVRRAEGGSFASALVFPGGTVDGEDGGEDWLPLVTGAEGIDAAERAIRIAALRELFEEVGLLVARDAAGAEVGPSACEGDFRAVVAASGGRLPLDALVPFARWITPEIAPKRWDTHFYLCVAPRDQEARCDAVETTAAEWRAPGDVLALGRAGERKIVFPTRLNLARLAESGSVAEAYVAAAARPRIAVLPKADRRPDGVYAVIPTEAGYAETEGLMAG